MTVLINVFGLLPILLDTGVDADVAKRIAAPMWGGLVSLTLLTLPVTPAVYVTWRSFYPWRDGRHARVASSRDQQIRSGNGRRLRAPNGSERLGASSRRLKARPHAAPSTRPRQAWCARTTTVQPAGVQRLPT